MRNRVALIVSAILLLGLVAGPTASASVGAAGRLVVVKKKKKRCPKGTHRVVVKRKDGTKKRKCVPKKRDGDETEPDDPLITAARLEMAPIHVTFPNTPVGGQSDAQTFRLTNTGGSPSSVPSLSFSRVIDPAPGGPPGFTVGANGCTSPLAPGAACSISMRFLPATTGQYGYAFVVRAGLGGVAEAGLLGTGVSPAKLTISPTLVEYPDTQQGTQSPPQTFTVTNTGGFASGPLATSITDVLDPVPGAFVLGTNGCAGVDLPPGGSCDVDVTFAPPNGGGGDYHSKLEVTGSPGITVQAQLQGHAD
jgi:hypothetical protein